MGDVVPFATAQELEDAAEEFVSKLGVENVKFLNRNLDNVETSSDALRALRNALNNAYVPENR